MSKNPNAVALGKLGGKAGTGKAKARTSEQARAAALVRWAKAKKQKVDEEFYERRDAYEERAKGLK